jgi:3',5'-cyclic AMP phosphodiesterase CpdA
MNSKLLHLSDIHIGETIKKYAHQTELLREKALERIFNEKASGAIISGDTVNSPSDSELDAAQDFIENLKKEFPVIIIPGNTDYNYYNYEKYTKSTQGISPTIEPKLKIKKIDFFPKPRFFDEQIKNRFKDLGYSIVLNGKYYKFIEYLDEKRKNEAVEQNLQAYLERFLVEEPELKIGNINFIGFNSTRDIGLSTVGIIRNESPNRLIYLAEIMDGALDANHIKKRLSKNKEKFNIAVMHHPIIPILNSNPIYGVFSNPQTTITELVKHNINMALCGHKHIPGHSHNPQYGNFHVCAAGTLFSPDIKKPHNDNSYNILDIGDDQIKISFREIRSGNLESIANFSIN